MRIQSGPKGVEEGVVLLASPPLFFAPELLQLPQVGFESDEQGYNRDVLVALEDRLLTDDESALREMFDEYGSLVLAISRRLVGADAEDLVQQVFFAAWKGRHQFDPSKGTIRAWLSGIARFKAIDHLRATARRPSTPTDEFGSLGSVAAEADRVIDRLVLSSALNSLPPARRQVIELGFFQGMTHNEISDHLDMPLGTVKSHSRRGLEALQHELDGARVL